MRPWRRWRTPTRSRFIQSGAGRGGDLIIVDDPLNAAEAHSEAARKKTIGWFTGSLLQRLNGKGQTPVIVMAQRLHEEDLAGHLLRTSEWKLLSLAAIAIEHERTEVPAAARAG